jgi:hypothetical protein
MILDYFVQFTGGTVAPGNSDSATDSPTTGTQTSSNIIDLHMAGIPVLANLQGARDMGIGDQPALKLLIQVLTAFVSGTSLVVNLQGATDNGSGAPAAFSTYYGSAAVAEASLVIGARLLDMDMPRPPVGVAIPRFLQLQYVSVGTHTLGKLRANIVLDRFDQVYNSTVNSVTGGYPPGIAIAN